MKALSLWQPWASLVVLGVKQIETRSWSTEYRGPIIIHATGSVPPPALDFWRQAEVLHLLKGAGVMEPRGLPMGSHIGTVDLVGVVKVEDAQINSQEERLGNYTAGRYAWLLDNPRELNEPVPAAGHQRLWNPPIELIEQVREALA